MTLALVRRTPTAEARTRATRELRCFWLGDGIERAPIRVRKGRGPRMLSPATGLPVDIAPEVVGEDFHVSVGHTLVVGRLKCIAKVWHFAGRPHVDRRAAVAAALSAHYGHETNETARWAARGYVVMRLRPPMFVPLCGRDELGPGCPWCEETWRLRKRKTGRRAQRRRLRWAR